MYKWEDRMAQEMHDDKNSDDEFELDNRQDNDERTQLVDDRESYDFPLYKSNVLNAIVNTGQQLDDDSILVQPKLTQNERVKIQGLCDSLEAKVRNSKNHTMLEQTLGIEIGDFQSTESKMLSKSRYALAILAGLANALMCIPIFGWIALYKCGFFSMSTKQDTLAGGYVNKLSEEISHKPTPR